MSGIALLFPGQGVDYRTVDGGIFAVPDAKNSFDAAFQLAEVDVEKLCNPSEEFRADLAPIVIFSLSMAAASIARDAGVDFHAAAGFSLGEYAALCTAGVFSLEDGMRIVAKRTALMNDAAKKHPGDMFAIIGLVDEAVEELCASVPGLVRAVNFNCPKQVVIAGEVSSVAAAADACLKAGAQRAVKLPVGGAFHTPLMADAAASLKEYLSTISFGTPRFPIYTNLTGDQLPAGTDIPAHLAAHMVNPVLWKKLMESMISGGCTLFGEAGPGNTLAGFAKRISREVKVVSLMGPDAAKELLV